MKKVAKLRPFFIVIKPVVTIKIQTVLKINVYFCQELSITYYKPTLLVKGKEAFAAKTVIWQKMRTKKTVKGFAKDEV